MSSTTRDGTDGAMHFHVWRGVLTLTGEITTKHRVTRSFKSRSQANQWLRAPGRRGPHSDVQRCKDEGCRARPFEASEHATGRATERLTQEFVDGVSKSGRYGDGESLYLAVWETKSGLSNKTWVMDVRLQGKRRHLNRNTPGFGQQTALNAGLTPVRGVGTGFPPRPGGIWLWLRPCSANSSPDPSVGKPARSRGDGGRRGAGVPAPGVGHEEHCGRDDRRRRQHRGRAALAGD